jgi:hypothetical protein
MVSGSYRVLRWKFVFGAWCCLRSVYHSLLSCPTARSRSHYGTVLLCDGEVDEMEPEHKRNLLFHWYATNIFNIIGRKRNAARCPPVSYMPSDQRIQIPTECMEDTKKQPDHERWMTTLSFDCSSNKRLKRGSSYKPSSRLFASDCAVWVRRLFFASIPPSGHPDTV